MSIIGDRIYAMGGTALETVFGQETLAQISTSDAYKQVVKVKNQIADAGDVLSGIFIKQMSSISGIGTHLKGISIGCQFAQIIGPVSRSAAVAFAGVKVAAMHSGFFRSIAVLPGTITRINDTMGRCFKDMAEYKSLDAVGAFLTTVSDITYLFSRVIIILNYVQKQIDIVPGLRGVVTVLAVPAQIGLLVGGVCQVTVAGTRLVSYLVPQVIGGKLFNAERDDSMSDTANAIVDLMKVGEGLSWIFEASVLLVACTNPWTMLSAVALSTGFQIAQIYVKPFLTKYMPASDDISSSSKEGAGVRGVDGSKNAVNNRSGKKIWKIKHKMMFKHSKTTRLDSPRKRKMEVLRAEHKKLFSSVFNRTLPSIAEAV